MRLHRLRFNFSRLFPCAIMGARVCLFGDKLVLDYRLLRRFSMEIQTTAERSKI
jgi:hypothetical protein